MYLLAKVDDEVANGDGAGGRRNSLLNSKKSKVDPVDFNLRARGENGRRGGGEHCRA